MVKLRSMPTGAKVSSSEEEMMLCLMSEDKPYFQPLLLENLFVLQTMQPPVIRIMLVHWK